MSNFFVVVGGSAATHGAFGLGGGGSGVGQSQLAIGSGMVGVWGKGLTFIHQTQNYIPYLKDSLSFKTNTF